MVSAQMIEDVRSRVREIKDDTPGDEVMDIICDMFAALIVANNEIVAEVKALREELVQGVTLV